MKHFSDVIESEVKLVFEENGVDTHMINDTCLDRFRVKLTNAIGKILINFVCIAVREQII